MKRPLSIRVALSVYLALVITLLPVSSSAQSSEDRVVGSTRNGVYTNEFFGFTFAIPSGWAPAPQSVQERYNNDLKAATHNASNRVLLMLIRQIDGAQIPDVVVITSCHYEPPEAPKEGVAATLRYFQMNRERGETSEVLRKPAPVQIKPAVIFVRSDLANRKLGQFLGHIALVTKEHLLSFQAHSASQSRMEQVASQILDSTQFGQESVSKRKQR